MHFVFSTQEHFFFACAAMATIHKGSELQENQAHTWLCKHYTPRGHSGQQRQTSFLQKWFNTQQLFHVVRTSAAAAIQGENTLSHTHRNVAYKKERDFKTLRAKLSRHMD